MLVFEDEASLPKNSIIIAFVSGKIAYQYH